MKTKNRITEADYIKANRRASREEEIAAHGKQISTRPKVHKSKQQYNRKKEKAAFRKLPFSYVGLACNEFPLIPARLIVSGPS